MHPIGQLTGRVAHLVSKSNSQDLRSYKEEVHATRKVREKLKLFDSKIIIENAKLASEILHSYDLDGRVLNSNMSIKKQSKLIRGLFGLSIMILFSPITFYSTGIQTLLAWYLGNNTDEGIDARTTYHMVAALISPLIFWPILSLISFLIISNLCILSPSLYYHFSL